MDKKQWRREALPARNGSYVDAGYGGCEYNFSITTFRGCSGYRRWQRPLATVNTTGTGAGKETTQRPNGGNL